MNSVISWIAEHRTELIVPALIMVLSMIALLWLRDFAFARLRRHSQGTVTQLDDLVERVARAPSVIWSLILSIYLALAAVASVPDTWKTPIGKGLWSLFTVSVTISALTLVGGLTDIYAPRAKVPRRAVAVIKTAIRVWIVLNAGLVVFDIWGGPTTAIVLFILVLVLAAALIFRDAAPGIFAGFQLTASQKIKVGDYIKLETGEEGYVVELSWNATRIRSPDGKVVIIPNDHLVKETIINYGRPLRKAQEPFRFSSRAQLPELTGLKARNLRELIETLKNAPDSVVYYHTHRFVEEHQFLVPELSNDFAYWASAALNNDILAERLAALNIMDFSSLTALRDRFVGVLEEYLASEPDTRNVTEGMEFHFIKSITAIMATPYVATDLREFVEALRKVSDGSIYFHLFESRLRLGRVQNDFSIWLEGSMAEPELAHEITHLDIYTSTLEGIRSTLIQLIEKRIK